MNRERIPVWGSVLLVSLFFLVNGSELQAQDSDPVAPSFFEALEYRSIGPYRTQFHGYAGSPGPDPYPTGALINFNLSEEAMNLPVRLEILDNSGRAVRSFATDVDEEDSTEKLNVREGLNRFEWNLNYEGPFTVPDLVTMVMRNPAEGPEAPPGTCRVRLTVNEWSQSRTFELKADLRWDVSREELSKAYHGYMNQYRQLIEGDLPEFNNLLKALEVPHVQMKEIDES